MNRAIISFRNLSAALLVFFCLCGTGWSQFGGRAGDLILYEITYNGSGDFQTAPPGTTNTAAQNAAAKVTHLNDVPLEATPGFGLKRQVLYTSSAETFQIGLDEENSVGLHRLPLYDLRLLQLEGYLNTFGNLIGGPNTFINIFKGLDVGGDISLTDVRLAFWFAGAANPFIVPTDTQGPFPCPPGTSGFLCLLFVPGGIDILSLEPWIALGYVYPAGQWQPGVDQKMLLQQPGGVTIRQVRLRSGKRTPLIRTAGHTHIFVLQGAGNVTFAGGATLPMTQYDYTLLPESTAVVITNPRQP
jgi:hypothetical protein